MVTFIAFLLTIKYWIVAAIVIAVLAWLLLRRNNRPPTGGLGSYDS